jgi:pyruvate dehydrogenase E2 component (dihydrolipoamide acetyltransferase)
MVTMPKLGFDMAEGTLVRWVKGEGEPVEKGNVLAEIETDKATVEVESTFSGVMFKHLVEQGTVVPVGTPIAVITAPGENPDLSNFEQADVEHGGETGASTQEPAREMPAGSEPKDVQPAESAPVAQAAEMEDEGEEEAPDGRMKVSPLARRMAAEMGVDLRRLKGTGPGGRIVKKDVEAAGQQPASAATPQAAPQPDAHAAAQPTQPRPTVAIPLPVWGGQVQVPADERVPTSKLRAIIARRMSESNQTIPSFSVSHEVRTDKLLALRSEINALLPDEQKLSVNDFVVKATAYALRQFPNLNASFGQNEIVRHGHVNIGIAVAVENGLLTIVVKDADLKPVRLISQEVKEMAGRARDGKVRPEDIEGSTFSISNLGMFDVEQFVAIINPPEAAILAVGSSKPVPVVEDGQVKVGQRMIITLTADHRVTDGAEAARFLQALAPYLEEPMRLMV